MFWGFFAITSMRTESRNWPMELRKHRISRHLTKTLYLCITGTFIRGEHPPGAANVWDQPYINSQNQFKFPNDFNVSGYLQLLKFCQHLLTHHQRLHEKPRWKTRKSTVNLKKKHHNIQNITAIKKNRKIKNVKEAFAGQHFLAAHRCQRPCASVWDTTGVTKWHQDLTTGDENVLVWRHKCRCLMAKPQWQRPSSSGMRHESSEDGTLFWTAPPWRQLRLCIHLHIQKLCEEC